MPLYDYIYIDLPKVISLYSQITGGVVESRETTQEFGRSADNKRNYDFTVFRHDAGGTENSSSGIKETMKPHHALLAELEHEIAAKGYMVDLSDQSQASTLRDPDTRARLSNALCVKVTGRVVVEDYERIKGIAGAFPEVIKIINMSIETSIRQSAAYVELLHKLEELNSQRKDIKDRNLRAAKESELNLIKKSLEDMVASRASIGKVEPWILDGLKTWIDTFLPGIVNLRVYPYVLHPDEQVFGHLKRECFVDSDVASFHFSYGSVPTEELTLIGVITSVPDEGEDSFHPLSEFDRQNLATEESVERGFRGVFRGFDGLEQMIRTCRFPRVLVQPLIVYRSVEAMSS